MLIKCRKCGGDVAFNPGDRRAECPQCGSMATVPATEDRERLEQHERAYRLWLKGAYGEALNAYEELCKKNDTDAEAHWGAALSRYGIAYIPEEPGDKWLEPVCRRPQESPFLSDTDHKAALRHAPDEQCRGIYEAEAAEIVQAQRDGSRDGKKDRQLREKAKQQRIFLYKKAVDTMNEAGKDRKKPETAIEQLKPAELDGYRDVPLLRKEAARRYEKCVAAENALKLKRRRRIKLLLAAAVAAAVILGGNRAVNEIVIPRRSYEKAMALQQQGKYEEAAAVFRTLYDYRDSAEQIVKCEELIREREYRAAVALQREGKYEEAAAAFDRLGDHGDSREQSRETRYLQAKALAEKGDHKGAVILYNGIRGYKDTDRLLREDPELAAAARGIRIAACRNVGGYVTFGTYPQTEAGDDSTPIEWLVLDYDADSGRALLISRYGLDTRPYNEKNTSCTWEESTLRAWLNSDFLNRVFTAEEQKAILLTRVDNGKDQGYGEWSADGGNNTEDRIFLLSYAEADKYLGPIRYNSRNNIKPRTAPTAYARARGAAAEDEWGTADGAKAGNWWLRTPGSDQHYSPNYAARVLYDGSLGDIYVTRCGDCVRPALWIDPGVDI